MSDELVAPDFLSEDADTIHTRMLSKAPPDVSVIEGDFFWDNTRPTAEEIALLETKLWAIIKLAFPQTSYGQWLKYLGEAKGIYKNDPTYAVGTVTVHATPGTEIQKDKIACTVGTDDKSSVEFKFLETQKVDSTGIAHMNVQCTESGIMGNVPAGSITLLSPPINGVQSITNEQAFSGGTDIETDSHYSDRIVEVEQQEKLSGADGDYIRWAKEVDGVGYAYVESEWNGPGTVKLLILDKNGQIATQTLIDSTQKHICPIVPKGQNRGGLAPIGATVTVTTPTILNLSIKATFAFTEGYDVTLVLSELKSSINSYVTGIMLNGTILFKAIDSIVGSFILQKKGIDDYSNLTVNNGTANITLQDQIGVVIEVVANAVP